MKLRVEIDRIADGRFKAVCRSLPGCTGRGSNPEEALGNLDRAVCGYLAAVNNFVPEERQFELASVEPGVHALAP